MSGTAAVAISTIALAESNRAQDTACRAVISAYNATGATVAQMQEYAACVHRLMPVDTSAPLWLKVAIVTMLVSTAAGTAWGCMTPYRDAMEGAITGFMVWFVVSCVLGLVAVLFS